MIYKTGDLARYRRDGTIEFLGRADHQVKIRGFRVELGEIETVLSRHPGVRDAVVGLGRTTGGDPQLVAYVVPIEHLSVDERILRIYLRQKLPDYMVPSRVVFMTALPTTPNGKVDRIKLPLVQPAISGAVRTTKTRTALEAIISRIWMDVLGVDDIGLHENLFDLGANSLTIAEAASSVGLAIERPVTLVDLFTYPTVHLLAGFLSGDVETGAILNGVAERARARRESLLRRARTDKMQNGRTQE